MESANAVLLDEVRYTYRSGAILTLSPCFVIGGAGTGVEPDASRRWELVFRDEGILLVDVQEPDLETCVRLEWQGLQIDIQGAGVIQSGGGFIGGGFGVTGAAVGMLAASVLNSLTTKTQMDTLLFLQSPSAELFLYYGDATPPILRRILSPVFLRLREQASPTPDEGRAGGSTDVVERLHKLANLLERELITREEFDRLKSDLLTQGPPGQSDTETLSAS